ncbi:hypothetical protein C0993_002120, partial [Termitomyces sp. T159_Od127]
MPPFHLVKTSWSLITSPKATFKSTNFLVLRPKQYQALRLPGAESFKEYLQKKAKLSDHGMVYVVDTATREILQKLSGSGLMQVIAAAKHEDGYDMIVGGSSFGGFEAYMWVKEPFESANEPPATGFTVVYAKWFSIAKQAAYCVL